jgi:hypothetical protein
LGSHWRQTSGHTRRRPAFAKKKNCSSGHMQRRLAIPPPYLLSSGSRIRILPGALNAQVRAILRSLTRFPGTIRGASGVSSHRTQAKGKCRGQGEDSIYWTPSRSHTSARSASDSTPAYRRIRRKVTGHIKAEVRDQLRCCTGSRTADRASDHVFEFVRVRGWSHRCPGVKVTAVDGRAANCFPRNEARARCAACRSGAPLARLCRPAPSGGEVGVKQAVDQDLAFGDGLDP